MIHGENMEKKKIIDLRVLNEGLFSHFLSAIGGFLLGKHSTNTIIKGQKEQIEILKNYLKTMKKNQKEKDELIDKLISIKNSSKSIQDMKKKFFDETGIKLP